MVALASRLTQLEKCRSDDLITAEEFADIRQRLLLSFGTYSAEESSSNPSNGSNSEAWAALHEDTSSHEDGNDASMPTRLFPGLERADFMCAESGDTALGGGIDDGTFWIDLVQDCSRLHHARPGGLREITMADLQEFDLSSGRIEEFFSDFDMDEDGYITFAELERGLETMGLFIKEDGAKKLVQYVSNGRRRRDSRGIDIFECGVMLTRLRLAELFTPSALSFQMLQDAASRHHSRIIVCDYNAYECSPPLCFESIDIAPDATCSAKSRLKTEPIDPRLFFFGQRRDLSSLRETSVRKSVRGVAKADSRSGSKEKGEPKSGMRETASRPLLDAAGPFQSHRSVRWVHVDATEGLDRLTLFRLAVKYHLHPLAVDDIIDNRTPTKLDIFDEHEFVSLDIFTLAKNPDEDDSSDSSRVRVHRSNVSIFLDNSRDTLLTILQSRPDQGSWLAMWWGRQDLASSIPDNSLWDKLVEDLTHDPPRRMRKKRADYLLYLLLDRVTDQLRPIAEAYANRLGFMHQHPLRTFPQKWLAELDELNLELVDLARSIRPMRQVLHHLVKQYSREARDDDSSSQFRRANREEQMYLEDVEDAIDQMLGDLEQLKGMGRSLEEAYEAQNERQANSILYNLSLAGTIFLPAQFITGVYGMNFVREDGTPAMPELTWEYGYTYFWLLQLGCLLIGLTIIFFSYYVKPCFGLSFLDLCRKGCCRRFRRRERRRGCAK